MVIRKPILEIETILQRRDQTGHHLRLFNLAHIRRDKVTPQINRQNSSGRAKQLSSNGGRRLQGDPDHSSGGRNVHTSLDESYG